MRAIKDYISAFNNWSRIKRCERKDFRTDRHIVVFESDDWGSIRMPQKKRWNELLRLGYAVDKRPYERFDTLESSEDLEALFNVLSKYKDINGNHPVITTNMLMANPDFEKIEKSGFQEYYYEPVANTYTRYFGDDKVLKLLRQGYEEGLIMPQSHGREHFNVAQWMRGLQAGDKDLHTAFQYGLCGIAPKNHPEKGNQMMKAFDTETEEEQRRIDSIVTEGLQMFERLWAFKSKTFVAPCYLWAENTEQVMAAEGVDLIQTSRVNKPAYKSPQRYFYTGQKNKFGQLFSIRNCKFEPATNEGGASVDDLMAQINKTFSQRKIAVFSTHRINFVGGINESNRTHTLDILDSFLTRLLHEYPDVLFLSSNQLMEVLWS